MQDRIKRENNIIVYGIIENENSELSEVNKVLQIVKPDKSITVNCDNIVRLGKKKDNTSRPRPLRVTLKNKYEVYAILKYKFTLKSAPEFSNVTLKKDETLYQRELLQKCRTALKERNEQGEEDLTIKYINGLPTIVKKN